MSERHLIDAETVGRSPVATTVARASRIGGVWKELLVLVRLGASPPQLWYELRTSVPGMSRFGISTLEDAVVAYNDVEA